MECVRLQVEEVEFGYSQITVRDGQGEKERVTILPALLQANLSAHLERVKGVPMTSERYKSSWVTRTSRRPWFTPTSRTVAGAECAARWTASRSSLSA